MKNLQIITLWILVIGLIAYTILDKWLNKPETSSYQDGSLHQTQLVNFQIPEGLSFAGELAPTKRVDIRQRLDREYYAFIFGHASTALTLRKAKQWLPIFEKILKEKGVHEDFKFLPIIESNLSNAVSPAGAAGFWQIMPEVAKYYGLEISEEVDERYHPIKSAYVAATILKENYQKFGSWALAAAAYNAGAGYLEGVVNYQKAKSYYDLYLYPETSRYVIRLLAFKDIYQNAAKYGFAIKEDKFYYLEATKELKVTESIEDLAVFAAEQGITYQKLLELNPWLKAKSLSVKEGKSYYIALPISAQPHKKST